MPLKITDRSQIDNVFNGGTKLHPDFVKFHDFRLQRVHWWENLSGTTERIRICKKNFKKNFLKIEKKKLIGFFDLKI